MKQKILSIGCFSEVSSILGTLALNGKKEVAWVQDFSNAAVIFGEHSYLPNLVIVDVDPKFSEEVENFIKYIRTKTFLVNLPILVVKTGKEIEEMDQFAKIIDPTISSSVLEKQITALKTVF